MPPPSSSRWVRPLAVRCGATIGSWPPCIACWPCGLPPGWITVARPTLSLVVFGWFWASWHPDMPLLTKGRRDTPLYRTAVFRYAPPSTAAAWARPTQPRSATLWHSSTTPTTAWTWRPSLAGGGGRMYMELVVSHTPVKCQGTIGALIFIFIYMGALIVLCLCRWSRIRKVTKKTNERGKRRERVSCLPQTMKICCVHLRYARRRTSTTTLLWALKNVACRWVPVKGTCLLIFFAADGQGTGP